MQNPVLVVGAGPVGLTMAAELTRYRVPVRIVDKSRERTDKSKALVVWSRTLELLDRLGIAGQFVAAGFKVHAANLSSGAKPIGRVGLDHLDTPYPFALMLAQSETERLLEGHLASLGVRVERETELTGFEMSSAGATAQLQHCGASESMDVPWLIGCDGAHSAVRHGLHMEFEGQTLQSDWILGDLHLEGVPIPPDELGLFFHADGVLAMFPLTPPRYRVIADMGESTGETLRPSPTLEEIQQILNHRGPGGMRAYDPVWLSSFRINERKVKDHRNGRAFLAGDAAHVHSPAGGQGMNTGMQDACNLAWKLAMVWHGQAHPRILDSYSIERSAVGRQVLKDAGRLTTLAVMRGRVRQAIRNHAASLLLGFTAVQDAMADKLAELAIDYPHSPLSAARGHIAGPAPGERVPMAKGQQPIGAGDTPLFALFSEESAQAKDVAARYAGLISSHIRPPVAPQGAWLVRPDGYVSAAAKHDDLSEIDRLLAGLVP